MNVLKLTRPRGLATYEMEQGKGRRMGSRFAIAAVLAPLLVGSLSGCINVAAPEEPIVIQLDINIRAEVLYRLAEDANNTIDEYEGVF